MSREKRRPTLDELRALPPDLWQMEMAQIAADAAEAGDCVIEFAATDLMDSPDLTPEMIVGLRERLQRATGSTVELNAA